MTDVLGCSVWFALYFVPCIVTDVATLESHENQEDLGQRFDPQYRAQRQSCTLHEQNILPKGSWLLKAETMWRPVRGRERGSGMSGLRAMCLSAPSKLWSGQSQHVLQTITITLLPTDSPFELCSSTTYWQSRERKEKKSRSNMCTVLKAWFQVFLKFFPTSQQMRRSDKAKATLYCTVFHV